VFKAVLIIDPGGGTIPDVSGVGGNVVNVFYGGNSF